MSSFRSYIIVSLLLGGLLFFPACDRRPSNVPGSGDMTSLLLDIYRLEGAMSSEGGTFHNDDVRHKYYSAVLEKHGMTLADFDSCLVWYTKNPKKFERIYARVIESLEKQEEDVKLFKYHLNDTLRRTDVWYHNRRYVQIHDSLRTKVDFTIDNTELLPNDRYVLSFLHRIAPSDSSINLRAVLYINYADSTHDSIVAKTFNDSTLRRYTMKLRAREMKKIATLSGQLLAYDSVRGKTFAYVDSVKLYREYNPQLLDKIKESLEQTASNIQTKSESVQIQHENTP